MGIKYDRFQVFDIDPIILVRKLIVKSDQNNMNKEQSVQLSMIDFYQIHANVRDVAENRDFASLSHETEIPMAEIARHVGDTWISSR